ncbi:hypothetical protein [Bifidobacterium eulemuris]|uniref:Uncharacterized protein n=1 Tax=Bifidobacterium eulemuris TaxID=1765219 RepID=A0A7L9SP06_9BIFI|nr:hypothetical protein [Bifidobacterium eulemuris]QOL31596.1 hypothetical protein BE0216_03320 [Bifidobacterium eulemuris]
MSGRTWYRRMRDWFKDNVPERLVFDGIAVLVVIAVLAIELPRLFG